MNKGELVNEIVEKTKLSKKAVSEVLTAVLEAVETAVAAGNKVTLVGFGTFEARKRTARTGHNPRTRAVINIPEKTVPVFSAGKKFKEAVR